MSSLVSLVLNNANKLPIVGNSIQQVMSTTTATMHHLFQQQDTSCLTPPPPPYEKEDTIHTKALQKSTLSRLTDFVWERKSCSRSSSSNDDETLNNITAHQSYAAAKINKEKVEEGLALIKMAVEVYNSSTIVTTGSANNDSQYTMSIELYMMGLEKVLSSLPIDSNFFVKSSLERKLTELRKKHDLVIRAAQEENEQQNEHTRRKLTKEQQDQALNGLSNLIIQAAVLTAIALKKSPIPGLMSRLLEMMKYALIRLDETCSVRERTYNLTYAGLAKAIEMDEHFKVHQFFAEIFYTGCTAILKAGIAYAECKTDEDSQMKEILAVTAVEE
ncbi:hypothetical protein BDF20DRAFT_847575 [Mycotypha africana]|uniref:uncharacterized protein n=1 Tax=Mycotypha africana TaxID=64632 RepID=UPI0023017613|nr:uncharacterized protein BDF20DRAFT_847575 [Mycotypha africana]KAI8991974.1 hypothetical protein BDF20DRAFT_847575 [Mycotypha africana]